MLINLKKGSSTQRQNKLLCWQSQAVSIGNQVGLTSPLEERLYESIRFQIWLTIREGAQERPIGDRPIWQQQTVLQLLVRV